MALKILNDLQGDLLKIRPQSASEVRLAVLLAVGLLGTAPIQVLAGQNSQAQNPPTQNQPAQTQPPELKSPGFQEFADRAQKYVQLHKSVEATVPKLKTTNEPELIVGHQKILARKIKA